jgi:hypothetical protein
MNTQLDITTQLDVIASEIEPQDPLIALALDKIADQLERAAKIHDTVDIDKHNDDFKRFPDIHQPTEVLKKVKEGLKNPKIERKVEEYIDKEYNTSSFNFDIKKLELSGSTSNVEKGKIKIYLTFDSKGMPISPWWMEDHQLNTPSRTDRSILLLIF